MYFACSSLLRYVALPFKCGSSHRQHRFVTFASNFELTEYSGYNCFVNLIIKAIRFRCNSV